MTGITKDELMQMARDAGMPFKALPDDYCDDMGLVRGVICSVDNVRFSCVEALVNAILERAAVELDAYEAVCMENTKTIFSESNTAWYSWGAATRHSAKCIRALKINTGD